jgi:hypothetical protein
MRIKGLATLAIALAFTTAAHAKRAESDEAAYNAAKHAVVAELKDPDSARFGTLSRQTRPNLDGEPMDVVCGLVNSRNSFGGYGGMSGFVYLVADGTVYFADGGGALGDLGAKVYYRLCG